MGHFWETIPQVSTDEAGIMKVFICSLLVAGASCLPAADPQLLYHAAPVPVLYHHNCRNITVSSCGLKPVEAGEAETLPAEEGGVDAERKRRDAEADPLLLYGAAPLVPAPVVPLLKHVCEEIQQEYC